MDDSLCCCFCSNPPQLLLEATSNGGLHTRNKFQLLSKCNSLYQGSNPMCCQDTDSHRQRDSKCHRWAESNYKFIIYSLTLHFHCSEKKETTKLVVYLICIFFSEAWNQTVPGTSKSEICLFWHMTIAYESQAKPVFTTVYSEGNLPLERYKNWMEDFFPGSSLHELKLNDYLPVLLPQHEHGPSVFLHTCFSKQR